jgi:5-methylcytosine-specific restriction endonuclease McrA
MNRKLYPHDWEAISLRIRERDGWKCAFCGLAQGDIMPSGGKVILTVSHINDPNPQNVDESNLSSLCQSCHNRLDAPMRTIHARVTRHKKRRAAILATGQQEMMVEEDMSG